ncbi:MAG: hypothetical protein K2W82_16570 [Candidatus Obscuribacterales bacterium]|nr:hypothetical protein [Candidatus Obscuribacterales bacterium]
MGKIIFAGGLFGFVCWLVALAAWIHGIILAFSASVLLGIICFFIQAPFPIFSIAYWITGIDLAQRIVDALPQIFG